MHTRYTGMLGVERIERAGYFADSLSALTGNLTAARVSFTGLGFNVLLGFVKADQVVVHLNVRSIEVVKGRALAF